MEPRLQRRIQRYGWDRAADSYEASWHRQLEPAQTRLLELAALRPGERVVDIACGTGLVTVRAAAAVAPNGEVTGTDISASMIEVARAAATASGLQNVSFARMDAEDLRLPDDSFDAALCALGLMYGPDPRGALQEMHRVLMRGRRAVAAVWGARSRCGWAEIFPIVDARVESEVCPLFFQLGSHDILARTFQDAGFANVTFERLSTALHYESGEEACLAAFVGGPVALAYFRFDELTREAVHAEYLASLEPYRRGSTYEVPGEFVVAIGYRR